MAEQSVLQKAFDDLRSAFAKYRGESTETAEGTAGENTAPSNANSGASGSSSGGTVSSAPVTSDVAQVYEVLAPMAGNYANAQAEQIGMAQQSMGPLAANTMGTTTSGLGNYTYNRLMRPQVDVMRDEILVQGYTNQLNRLLSDKLNEARNRYNRSGNSGGGGGTTSNGNGTVKIDEENTDETGGETTTSTVAKEVPVDGSAPGTYHYSGKNKVTGTTETGIIHRDANGNITYLNHQMGAGHGVYRGEDAQRKWDEIKGHIRENSITYRRTD